jgi:hypothetical protein
MSVVPSRPTIPAELSDGDGSATGAVVLIRRFVRQRISCAGRLIVEPENRPVRSGGDWVALVERILRSWPTTLRAAFLLTVLLAGTAEIVTKVGLTRQFAVIVLNVWCRRRSR